MFRPGEADHFIDVLVGQRHKTGMAIDGGLQVGDLVARDIADLVAPVLPRLMIEVLPSLHLADRSTFHPFDLAHGRP